MSSTAIITDTDASLPREVAARYGIRQVPIAVHFGDQTFMTGVDINDTSLFRRVDREGELPTTSAPAPGSFLQSFEAAFEAAKAARSGASKEEIIERALDVGRRTCLFAALSTLKYLAMSGRVGHLTAGMASLLSIKPILTLRDGELQMLERVRTRKKAWARVIELTERELAGSAAQRMAVVHVDALAEARPFKEKLRARLSCPETIITAPLTPGLSVHTGAGLVGVAAVSPG